MLESNRLLTAARLLLIVTILYNVVEGVIALWSGIAAGSIALVAFGADSYIEVAAASLVLWRLGIEDSEYAEVVEHRIVRFIGWTFLVLATAIVFRTVWALIERSSAEESLVGIGLAVVSVIVHAPGGSLEAPGSGERQAAVHCH